MHDIYTLGAPLLVVLVGLIYNGQQVRELRGEMRALRGEMRDLRNEIHKDTSELRAEFQAINRLLTELLFQHAERITKIESK